MYPRKPPAWLRRSIVADELRALGLPFVADAWWRRPSDGHLTYALRLEAITTSCAVVAGIRRRLGPVPRGLRDAVWRLTVAGLARLPREAWPTRRPADDTDELTVRRPEPEPEPDDEPLVIRRREGGQRHAT